jgi:L-threonine kinase
MKAIVRVPGSCGELVQGTLDGHHFLITCPIDLYSEVIIQTGQEIIAADNKAMAAVFRTWEYLQVAREPFSLQVDSVLPKGKGMASSSADISAACQAAALIAGRTISLDEIADIALGIEPTDGVFYPGIVMFDHVQGTIRRHLGSPPPMQVAIFDGGGQINTIEFNQRSDLVLLNRQKEAQIRQAVQLVIQGLAIGDCGLIGQGATISALANQEILFKPCIPVIVELLAEFGAVGVNTAHSGTVIGVLFSEENQQIRDCVAAVSKACPELAFLGTAQMISGGLSIREADDA